MAGDPFWDAILTVGTQVLGNVVSSSIANDGVNKASDAATAANAQSLALQRDIFNTNLNLSKPFYQGSGNAFNLLSNIYGLPAQNFSFPGAAGGGSSGGLSANLGAGQPVAGHTGGGGSNGFAQAAGGIAGSFFGPIGSSIGSALGGLVQNGGDNWQTVATQAPAGYDYEAYMQSPGLKEEWAKPDIQALFGGNRDAYAYWHANGGNLNGKQSWAPNMEYLTEVTSKNPQFAGDKTTMPVGGAQLAGQSGNAFSATGTSDPLQLFWNSPDGQLAKNQFLTIDNPAIKGAFATAGKSLSGAQQKALADRGAAMGGNAFNNYRSGLQTMAGMGPSASGQAQAQGNAFATNAGNIMQNTGAVNAKAALQTNANWGNAFNNVASGAYDYAKGQKWI